MYKRQIHGGGVFNGLVFKRPSPSLMLRQSTIRGNSISGGKLSAEGAGLYTKGFRISREQSVIGGNTPVQCAGC